MPHHPPRIRPSVESLDARIVLNGTFTVHAMVLPATTKPVVSSIQYPATTKLEAERSASLSVSVAAIRSGSTSSQLTTTSRPTLSEAAVSTTSVSRMQVPKRSVSSIRSTNSVTLSHEALRAPSSANLTTSDAPFKVVAPTSGLAFRSLSRISINGRLG